MENKTLTYEDCHDTIDAVIRKAQKKWQLKAINWFDFDDVAQIVKLHIYTKWHLWDQARPLEPWVARVTDRQIKNIIRNNYTNYVKPCMQCKYNMGDNLCALTRSGTQNTSCETYAKWYKNKRSGYGIKLPLPMENHSKEIDQHHDNPLDFNQSIDKLNAALQIELSPIHYRVYIMLFFENRSEDEVAAFMGYKTNEKNRKAGYKQIKNLKKMLQLKAEDILKKNDII